MHFVTKKDEQGILTVIMDMPGQSVNTMNKQFDVELEKLAATLTKEADSIKGMIIASAKTTFFAGGDLHEILELQKGEEEAYFRRLEAIKANMRTIEMLGKPIVAAINGAALGGGYELALMCHYRVALNNPKTRIGLPEATLGLLPGGGGVTRLVRMFGVEKALPYLTEGTTLPVGKALEEGFIDLVVDTDEEMMAAARDWILAHEESVQPWDVKGYKIPGGEGRDPQVLQTVMMAPAVIKKKTRGLYPAPEVILATVAEGACVDFETASRIESRNLAKLAVSPVAKNLISTYFFQLNDLKAGGSRPDGFEKSTVNKVGVLGAGMMGSGIAFAAAKAGVSVVLADVSLEGAEKGKSYSEKLLDKAISRGKSTEADKKALLDRIQATADVSEFADCDLIIEAVFEDEKLKDEMIKKVEEVIGEDVVFASNTSTLPISMLAESSKRPDKFIGMHFFSPVDKMELVEIIVGKETADATLARAFDFVLQIRKTPIVVNDSLGFFTSRVFATFSDEGVTLLQEGVDPLLIDNLTKLTGMPVGPLTVWDEVSLKLTCSVRDTNRRLIEARGGRVGTSKEASDRIHDEMVVENGRLGRAYGGGFYDYPEGGQKHIWPGLKELYPVKDTGISHEDIKDRILFRQVIESLQCLEENVLRSVRDGNIGSVFGIGFPHQTGGVFQLINSWGVDAFVDRCRDLASKYGDRFTPPEILLKKQASRETFE